MTRHRRTLRIAVACLGLGALAGCGSIHPGDAAKIGGYTVSRSDLDTATSAQCVLAADASQGGQQAQQKTSRAATAQSTIALLVQARQGVRYAEIHDISVDAAALRTQRVNFADQLKGRGLSSKEKDALLDVSDQISRGQAVAQAAGAKSLGVSAEQAAASQQVAQQAVQAGSQIVGAWAVRSGPRISIDPRYNVAVEKGQLRLQDGSVSKAVSSVGKQSATQQPKDSYVTGLPLPQRCG